MEIAEKVLEKLNNRKGFEKIIYAMRCDGNLEREREEPVSVWLNARTVIGSGFRSLFIWLWMRIPTE